MSQRPGQRCAMHLISADRFAEEVDAVERGDGVVHHKRGEAQVSGHTSGGAHTVIGGQSNQHHRLDGGSTQVSLQSGANET